MIETIKGKEMILAKNGKYSSLKAILSFLEGGVPKSEVAEEFFITEDQVDECVQHEEMKKSVDWELLRNSHGKAKIALIQSITLPDGEIMNQEKAESLCVKTLGELAGML